MIKSIYEEKGINVDQSFYDEISYLSNLYDQIVKIYSRETKVIQFLKSLKKSLVNNEAQQFEGFPENVKEIFQDFYDSYNEVIKLIS